MKKSVNNISCRAKGIKLLIMDVDGVLTAGSMIVMDSGKEIKVFDVHDGLGIMLWKKAGFKTAIITAGNSDAVTVRASVLKIDKVYQAVADKLIAYEDIKKIFDMTDSQICFIGDDLVDIPILRRAGLSCAVANAHKDILSSAHYRCKMSGGQGAAREVIDMILKTKGIWPKLTKDYFK